MISFREQVILIVYFLIFGMFLSAMFDMLHYFLRKLKMRLIPSYIIQIIFWIGMVIISCLYMLKVSEGYLTIYTFGFFFLGVVIYTYLLRNDFKNNMNLFVLYIAKVFNKFKKTIILLVYPKEVLFFIKKVVRFMKKIKPLFISIYKKVFKRKENSGGENEEVDNELDANHFISSERMR